MSEWKETRVSDIVDIIGGGTPKTSISEYWNGEIPWLSVVDFNNGRKFVFETEKKITEKGLKNSSTKILNKGDLIISARGTVGVVSMLGREMAFNQSCYGIRAKEGVSTSNFTYYLLKEIVRNLKQISHGGVFDTITRDTFNEVLVALPPLQEQKAIASVLSSLDDKIDLLHRQNKTLEAMAETLFRQWFVEEAEDDWESTCLKKIINIKHGFAFKGGDITDQETEKILVTPGNFKIGGGFKHDKYKFFSGDDYPKEYEFNPNDLIVTMTDLSINTDTLGYPAFVPEIKGKKFLHNQRVGKVILKAGFSDWKYYLYLLMRTNDYRSHVVSSASGTSIMHTSPDRICSYKFKSPPRDKLDSFNNIVRCSFEKIIKNNLEIQTLDQLRDKLLPKLMSGEVRVLNHDLQD